MSPYELSLLREKRAQLEDAYFVWRPQEPCAVEGMPRVALAYRPAEAFNPALQDGVLAWVGLRLVAVSLVLSVILEALK